MWQVALFPRSGRLDDAAFALERLVPTDVVGLKPGRHRDGILTNRNGGTIDDMMITNRGDHLLLVVNASTKSQVVLHLREHFADLCDCCDPPLLILLQPDEKRGSQQRRGQAGPADRPQDGRSA
jgi:aminomethyltransferase